MAFDGNGNWISDFSAVADRDAGIKILASRFDNIFINDIATSFENCLTKDGQVKTQTNFNANNYRVINVSDPVNDKDAVNKESLESRISTMLNSLYPVGSVYIGTQNTCPMSSLITGSTWTLVSSGKALWTGDGTNGNTTIDAGLPDHKHYVSRSADISNQSVTSEDGGTHDTVSINNNLNMSYLAPSTNASYSNPIYGNSTTVQPPAYVVNVWRRTA